MLIIAVCVAVFFSCNSGNNENQAVESAKWRGKINRSGQVVEVINPAEPAFGAIDLELKEVLSIGRQDDDNYFFFKFIRFDVDEKSGDIYILDFGNTRIQRFDKFGKYLQTIGRKGQGPSEFMAPTSIQLDAAGNLVVLDASRFLKIIDTNGKQLSQRSFPLPFTSLKSAGNGSIIATRFDLDYAEGLSKKKLVHIDSNGEIQHEYLTAESRSIIISGNDKISVSFPSVDQDIHFYLTANGQLYCGVNSSYVIFKYRGVGLTGKIQVDRTPPPLTGEEKDSLANNTYIKHPKSVTNQIKKMLPDYKPAFHAIRADKNGWLFVFRRKSFNKSDEYIVDVFDPEGKYLYKTSFNWIPEIIGPVIWVSVRNEDGDRLLKKYEIPAYNRYFIKK